MSIDHKQMNYFELKTSGKITFSRNSGKNGEHTTNQIWNRKRTKNK